MREYTFYYWRNAVRVARTRAHNTGRRQRVFKAKGLWTVTEAVAR